LVEVAAALANPANLQKWNDLTQYAQHAQIGQGPTKDERVRRRQRRLSDSQIDELVSLFLAGTPRLELASHFGIHPGTVSALLTRRGLLRVRGLSPQQVDAAAALYIDSGWSLQQIGDQLGFSAGTVRKALLDAGVRTRPRTW